MGLKHADVVANILRYPEKLVRLMDVGGYAEIGALDGDEAEEMIGEGGI